MSTPKIDPYQQVTDRIIEALEAGTAPWVKPWRSLGRQGILRNATTGRPYNGVNVWLLGMEAYADPRWLTFKQAKEAGGTVRKGEHGTKIVFWRMLKVKDRDAPKGEERTKTVPMLRLYTVFNVEQCDGLKLKGEVEAEPLPEVERDAQLDTFVSLTGADISHGGAEACYVNLPVDRIKMPKPETFADSGAYYATLLHELTHWTRAPHRCDRPRLGDFGSTEYAKEELIAEMGSAFLCQRFEVDGTLQHPAYIASWLKALKGDKKFIFSAASKARKACEWLYETTNTTTKEAAPVAASAA